MSLSKEKNGEYLSNVSPQDTAGTSVGTGGEFAHTPEALVVLPNKEACGSCDAQIRTFLLHEKHCQELERLKEKQRQADLSVRCKKIPLPKIPSRQGRTGSLNDVLDESLECSGPHQSRQPLQVPCKSCGIVFNRHSIPYHEKQCIMRQRRKTYSHLNDSMAHATQHTPVVARVVTIGLVPGQFDVAYVKGEGRPKTRNLPHSSVLEHTDYGLPLANGRFEEGEHSIHLMQCMVCDKVVARNRLGVHLSMCGKNKMPANTNYMQFPSEHNFLRVQKEWQHQKKEPRFDPRVLQNRKLHLVTCFVCGQEFGSKSIAIHEPQCLKKFIAQNNMLPISKRQPIPTKQRLGSAAGVARVVSSSPDRHPGPGENLPRQAGLHNMSPSPLPNTEQRDVVDIRSILDQNKPVVEPKTVSSQKPSLVRCYVCQQEYSSRSIAIHESQCLKKFVLQNRKLPIMKRLPLPIKPRATSVISSDNEMLSNHVHKRPGSKAQSEGHRGKKPLLETCYICQREFGSKSISIHEPQCLKKLLAQNEKLPISERSPVPKKRQDRAATDMDKNDTIGGIEKEIDNRVQEYFDQCYAEFEKDLIPCKKCGRTFTSDRHVKHEPNCNAKPIATRLKH